MRRWLKRLAIAVAILAVLILLGFAWYRYNFPYGYSHCCDITLSFALELYDTDHDGWYPRGEATPEASLSLVYDDQELVSPSILRGKTVPEAIAKDRLESGQLLTPETCGWHYVDDLRKDDEPGLALFWDKAGLGHHGQRLSEGGHTVWFVGGDHRHVPGKEWDSFMAEQERLRANLKRPPKAAKQ